MVRLGLLISRIITLHADLNLSPLFFLLLSGAGKIRLGKISALIVDIYAYQKIQKTCLVRNQPVIFNICLLHTIC